MQKEKRMNLYQLKGWKSYVAGYKNYTKQYDSVNFDGKGTIKPKKVTKDGNKTTIVF